MRIFFGPLEYKKKKSKKYWKNNIQESSKKKYNFAPDAANHNFFFWLTLYTEVISVYFMSDHNSGTSLSFCFKLWLKNAVEPRELPFFWFRRFHLNRFTQLEHIASRQSYGSKLVYNKGFRQRLFNCYLIIFFEIISSTIPLKTIVREATKIFWGFIMLLSLGFSEKINHFKNFILAL